MGIDELYRQRNRRLVRERCKRTEGHPGTSASRISKEDQRVRETEEEGRGRELKWEDDRSIAVVSHLILYSLLLQISRLLVE